MRFVPRRAVLTAAVAALMLLGGCSPARDVNIEHLHGLGFSPDGRQLYVPAHHGFVIFSEGRWQVPDLPKHDYMGYSATADGFYSSGHPAPNSGLPNPLGLVRSSDGGKSLKQMGFQGEIDFHLMGAGYRNHVVYVLNPAAAGGLEPGLHYTTDDGKSWRRSSAQGISGQPFHLAVHPTEAGVMAIATEKGLFLSRDHGNRFEQIGEQVPVTAAAFAPTGDRLLFGFRQLFEYGLNGGQVRALQVPTVGPKDAIGYVAINPVQPGEIVIGTFERNIHRSADGGQTWASIAVQGKGRSAR